MNKLLFVTILASILVCGYSVASQNNVYNIDPTNGPSPCTGTTPTFTCKAIDDALLAIAKGDADVLTAKIVLKGNVVLTKDLTGYDLTDPWAANTNPISAKITSIASDTTGTYSIDFGSKKMIVGAAAQKIEGITLKRTGSDSNGVAFFLFGTGASATNIFTVSKCNIAEAAQNYLIADLAVADSTLELRSNTFNLKARSDGNIKQAGAVASKVSVLGGTYVINKGANPTDAFIVVASNAKTTIFDLDVDKEVLFNNPNKADNGPIYTNDGLVAHILTINSLTVQDYKVAAALFISQPTGTQTGIPQITVTSCKFSGNTNTDNTVDSENGIGVAFRIKDSFISINPADKKTIEFSNNIANIGPALAVLASATLTTPASNYPASGSLAANIIGKASFSGNVARYEGGAIYVYLKTGDVTSHYGKLLKFDTNKKISWNSDWSFSGNKAYAGSGATLTTSTPYSGDPNSQFSIFFYSDTYKTSSFRFSPPTYTNGPNPSVAFNNGIPYIKDVLPGQNIASKITFTYGDINGNPLWESGVSAWRPTVSGGNVPTQIILKATAEASSAKVAYDLLSTDTSNKNVITTGTSADVAAITTPFLVKEDNGDFPKAVMSNIENAAWFKIADTVTPNCPTHKGVITKQVFSATASNELTLSNGPQLDTADSSWFLIVRQDITADNSTFVRSSQNPVIPENAQTSAKVVLALPIQFRDIGCLNQCKLNEYVEGTSTCKTCNGACKQCSGPSDSDCLVCANGQAPISGKCGCTDTKQVLANDGTTCNAVDVATTAVKALTWTETTLDDSTLTAWQNKASYAANLFLMTSDAGLLPSPDKPCGNSCSGSAKGTCMTNMTLVPYCKCVTDGTGALCQYAAADLTTYTKVGGDASKALNSMFGTLDKTKHTVGQVKKGGLAIQTLLAAPDTLDETALGYLITIMQKIVDTPTLIDQSNRPALGAAQQRLFQAVVSRRFASNDTKKANLDQIQKQQQALVNSQFTDQFAILTANKGNPTYIMGDQVSSALLALDTSVATTTLTLGDTKVVFPQEFMTLFKSETAPVIVRVQTFSNNIYAAASTTTALNSSVVQINVMSGADAATALASNKPVANLAKPITITLPITNGAKNLTCAYWNETTSAWDTTGVTTNASTATTQNCETIHLTSFGGVVGSLSNGSAGNGSTDGNTTGTFAPNLNLGYVYVYVLAILGFIAALV